MIKMFRQLIIRKVIRKTLGIVGFGNVGRRLARLGTVSKWKSWRKIYAKMKLTLGANV